MEESDHTFLYNYLKAFEIQLCITVALLKELAIPHSACCKITEYSLVTCKEKIISTITVKISYRYGSVT